MSELTTVKHKATYSPEDDKIRIYLDGRLDKEEWMRFKDAGYSWTMKQESDLAATWTVTRENLALEFCGDIEDHDIDTRADRAADRAERFSGYRDRRELEAIENLDNTVDVVGMQSEKKADIVARRSQRAANKATNNWEKAEYWQQRTAGVIENALYLERSDVRYRRIKKLEAELRKSEKSFMELINKRSLIKKALKTNNEKIAKYICEYFWIRVDGEDLYSIAQKSTPLEAIAKIKFYPCTNSLRYRKHLKLRIAYERQMLEAVGDNFEDKAKDYKVGGSFGKYIIMTVNKSLGAIASVTVFDPGRKEEMILSVEGIPHEDYKNPTAESKKLLKEYKLEKNPPLLNLSIDDSKKLCKGKGEVICMTSKEYTAKTKSYCSDSFGTYFITEDGGQTRYKYDKRKRLFKVRAQSTGFGWRDFCVIHLTDKPVKPMPEMEVREHAEV